MQTVAGFGAVKGLGTSTRGLEESRNWARYSSAWHSAGFTETSGEVGLCDGTSDWSFRNLWKTDTSCAD